MSDTALDSAPRGTPPRRRWWQFSLANLLLVAVIVCIAAAYYGSRRELDQARRKLQSQQLELEELHQQIGIILVTDESKIYLKDRQTPFDSDPFHWRWRIHLPQLPANSRWSLKHELVNVKDATANRSGSGVGFIADGQLDLEVVVNRDFDGKVCLSTTIRGMKQQWESTTVVPDQEFQSLRRLVRQGGVKVSGRQLVVAATDKPLELVEITAKDKIGEQTGLIIYLERIDEKKPHKK